MDVHQLNVTASDGADIIKNKEPWLRVIVGILVIPLGAWYLISLFLAGGIQHSHH